MSLIAAVALQRQMLSTLLKVFFFFWKNFATLMLTRSLTTGRKTWQSGVCWAQPRWTSPPCTCAWRAHLLHRCRKARRRTVTKNKLNTTRTVWDSVLRPWWIPVGEHRPCWCEKKTEPPRRGSYRPSGIHSFKRNGRNFDWTRDCRFLSLYLDMMTVCDKKMKHTKAGLDICDA